MPPGACAVFYVMSLWQCPEAGLEEYCALGMCIFKTDNLAHTTNWKAGWEL